jgi:U6 snRNA-associated Sm-like protein LSm8
LNRTGLKWLQDSTLSSTVSLFEILKRILLEILNSATDTVSIITSDGRNFIGTLKGFDQTINVIIDESHERVYSTTSGVEQVMLGLHIIRGDNVAIVGLIDDELDNRLNLANIKAEPLNSVAH